MRQLIKVMLILAGFFLGFAPGVAASFAGVLCAAMGGYFLSRKWGEPILRFLVKEEAEREELNRAFQQSGPVMIMLSRAAPMLPEVTACMAGATRMSLQKYLVFFLLGTLPYVTIAAYAGSISSLDSPRPAIFAALFLYGVLWLGWYAFRRSRKT